MNLDDLNGYLPEALLVDEEGSSTTGAGELSVEPLTTEKPLTTEEELSAEFSTTEEVLVEEFASETPTSLIDALSSEGSEGSEDMESYLANIGIREEHEVPDLMRPWMKHHEFVRVQSIEEVRLLVDEALRVGRCSLDLETEGLDNRIFYDAQGKPYTAHKIVGYCICVHPKQGYYIPVRHQDPDSTGLNVDPMLVEAEITRLCRASQPGPLSEIQDSLDSKKAPPSIQVVINFWHAAFDQEFLYPVTGIDWWHSASFEDGNLAAFCLNSTDKNLGLKEKAAERLRDPDGNPYTMIEMRDLFIKGRRVDFSTLSPDEPGVVRYACSDAICTQLLSDQLVPLMHSPQFDFTYRLEKQVAQVKRVMERNRVKVDRSAIVGIREKAATKREELSDSIRGLAVAKGFHNFEPSSPAQLSRFLFSPEGMNLTLAVKDADFPQGKPKINEKSQQYKTDADTLENFAKLMGENAPPILRWIIEYREQEKILGTYLNNILQNLKGEDELRFQFKQTGAATGRFSAPAGDPDHGYSGIPIHGIPGTSTMRNAFVAREGYLMVKCDYAGEELRIVSNLSMEPVWIQEFLEGDGDLHSITARAFFGKEVVTKEERKMGKCVHPDTLVILNGQVTSLRGLPYSEPDTFCVQSPTSVWTGSGEASLAATFNGGVKPLAHVVLNEGVLTCTKNHRLLMCDGSLVAVKDLEPGMVVAPVEVPGPSGKRLPTLHIPLWEGVPVGSYQMTEDLAYLAGLFAGDGTGNASSLGLTHGRATKIDAYGDPYSRWIETLQEACSRCGLDARPKDSATLYLGSRVLVRFFRALGIQGKHRKDLHIPEWVLNNRRAAMAYLGGLFDTDGTVGTHSPNIDFTTKSFTFAGQISFLLRSCRLRHSIELTFNTTYRRYYARVRLTVGASWKMASHMRHIGKVSRLRAPIYQGRPKNSFEVRGVIDAGEGPCVDLSLTQEPHLYAANGFVTHNTANFALVYGGGPAAIMRATGCDRMEAQRRKQAFDKAVPTFAKWVARQHQEVKKNLGVTTAFRRWIPIPDAKIRGGETDSYGRIVDDSTAQAIRAACERHSINYPIQSAGADIMKLAMILVHKELHQRKWLRDGGSDSVRMLLSVHDEIVFEVKPHCLLEALEVITRKMEVVGKFPKPPWRIPLVTDPLVGTSWGAALQCWRHNPKVPLKAGETLAAGFVFPSVPDWLEPILAASGASLPPEATPEGVMSLGALPEAAGPLEEPLLPSGGTPPLSSALSPSLRPRQAGGSVNPTSPRRIVTVRLQVLNLKSVRKMKGLAGEYEADSEDIAAGRSAVLRVVHNLSDEVLVDPSLGIVVQAEALCEELLRINLISARYTITIE